MGRILGGGSPFNKNSRVRWFITHIIWLLLWTFSKGTLSLSGSFTPSRHLRPSPGREHTIHWRRNRGGGGGMCPPFFRVGGAKICLCPPHFQTQNLGRGIEPQARSQGGGGGGSGGSYDPPSCPSQRFCSTL